MQETQPIAQKVDLFMSFIQASDSSDLSRTVTSFFINPDDNEDKRIVYDRGRIMMISDGELVSEVTASAPTDINRIVSFDGHRITEINPYSYITPQSMQMKGDSSRRRNRGGSSSNNNNNNNNG
jgi:hypothetical protein